MQKTLRLLDILLLMFFPEMNPNVTTQSSLSPEMKTFYSDYLIDNAKPNLVHDQFAQKHPIPKGRGKTIEFRKYSPLPKALTPLTEAVTPDGGSLSMTIKEVTVKQYGFYITLSDMLILTALDNNLVEASKLLGNQAGETLDTITREVMNSGTNVQYADGQVVSRHLLVGGDATPANNHLFTVNATRRAVRNLKSKKAKKISGDYVGIIHTDIAYDLTGDPKWEDWRKYAKPEELYNGEIGKFHGVRFIETTEAKIFAAPDLSAAARDLTLSSVSGKVLTIDQTLTAGDVAKLPNRNIIVKGYLYTIESATTTTITVKETVQGTPTDGEIIYPGEAGAKGRAVYSTLILGADAYGTTDVSGGGLEFIVTQLGSAGGADPLKQRATSGWKAIKAAIILVDEFMLRVETASTFNGNAN